MYLQLASSAIWAQDIANFCASAVNKHERSGPHHIALAMWVSGGEMTSALGTLPPHVRTGVPKALRAVCQSEKLGGSLFDFVEDLSMIELCGVLRGYRSQFFARVIGWAIAMPFCNAEGTIIQSSDYVPLASDSAMDRATHKAKLVYYRMMFEGKPRTAFIVMLGFAQRYGI